MATYRIPRELDILPPRPVLFPYLPSVEALGCCFGGEIDNETPTPGDIEDQYSPITIDAKQSFETAITEIDDVDDCTSSIPDMSSLSGYSDVDSYRSHGAQDSLVRELPNKNDYHHNVVTTTTRGNQKNPLVSLEDIISIILQMILRILSAKRFLLGDNERQNQVGHGRIQADSVDRETKAIGS